MITVEPWLNAEPSVTVRKDGSLLFKGWNVSGASLVSLSDEEMRQVKHAIIDYLRNHIEGPTHEPTPQRDHA